MRHARRQAMAQKDAAKTKRKQNTRSLALIRGLAAFSFVGMLGLAAYQLLLHPDTPLPQAWNPTRALVISDPVTPLTQWKLNRAAASTRTCLATINGFSSFDVLPDLEDSAQCGIAGRISLRGVGDTRIATLETRCAIALRMAMWERHGLQPAAQDILGTSLIRTNHAGSYNCRTIRGSSSRMSTHATADAIDILGFTFANGQQINLLRDWNGEGSEAAFLRAARDSACDWFRVTLSPEYNTLHADHFHLQSTGWGLCR